jgi:hypothetical protein
MFSCAHDTVRSINACIIVFTLSGDSELGRSPGSNADVFWIGSQAVVKPANVQRALLTTTGSESIHRVIMAMHPVVRRPRHESSCGLGRCEVDPTPLYGVACADDVSDVDRNASH